MPAVSTRSLAPHGMPCSGPRYLPALFQQPWVHGLAAEPDVVERQRTHAQLGDQNGARLVEEMDYCGVLRGHAAAERLGPISGRDAGGIHQIFGAQRDAMQRAAIFAGPLPAAMGSWSGRRTRCR